MTRKTISIKEYKEKGGFRFEKVYTIFESALIHSSKKDWFKFPAAYERGLKELVFFPEKRIEDNPIEIVYLVEQLEKDEGLVHCTLVESERGLREILDSRKKIIKVHQMYRKFWEDHISLNFQ